MRNVRALLAISAVSVVAVGCARESKPAAPPPTVPVAPAPVAAQPPAPASPPVAHQPTEAPPGEAAVTPPAEAQPPAHAPIAQSTHDLVIDALLCALPPGPTAVTLGGAGSPPPAAPQGEQPQGASPEGQGPAAAGGLEARCGALAPNVTASELSQHDAAAVRAVREQIERRASEERLDDTMRMHLLALYDRGIAAESEALAGEKIADHYAIAGAERTAKQRPSAQAPKRERQHAQAVPSADLATLASHDKLRDLLQFARTSDAPALGSEAEGLAWVLGADRFVQAEALPPRLRPFAAEPLFDALLGVPTPPQAQALDITRMTPAVWSQYLETAARTVGMGVPPQAGQGAIGGGPHGQAAQHHPAGQAARDQRNMREILTGVSQRMEALSRRMPASDLRIALDDYATGLQAPQTGVGGGPSHPEAAPPSTPSPERPPAKPPEH